MSVGKRGEKVESTIWYVPGSGADGRVRAQQHTASGLFGQ